MCECCKWAAPQSAFQHNLALCKRGTWIPQAPSASPWSEEGSALFLLNPTLGMRKWRRQGGGGGEERSSWRQTASEPYWLEVPLQQEGMGAKRLLCLHGGKHRFNWRWMVGKWDPHLWFIPLNVPLLLVCMLPHTQSLLWTLAVFESQSPDLHSHGDGSWAKHTLQKPLQYWWLRRSFCNPSPVTTSNSTGITFPHHFYLAQHQ